MKVTLKNDFWSSVKLRYMGNLDTTCHFMNWCVWRREVVGFGCKWLMDILEKLDYNHFENQQTLKHQFNVVLSIGTIEQTEHFI